MTGTAAADENDFLSDDQEHPGMSIKPMLQATDIQGSPAGLSSAAAGPL